MPLKKDEKGSGTNKDGSKSNTTFSLLLANRGPPVPGETSLGKLT